MSASLLREVVAALEERRSVVLCTVVHTDRSVPRHAGSKMLLHSDGRTSGTVGGGEMEARVVTEAGQCLDDGRPRRLTYSLVDPATGDPGVCGGNVEIYLEPYMPQSTLYLVGAGHVGRAVAELASWLDYRVVVWDDRPEVLDELDAIDGVDAVLSGTITDAVAEQPIDAHTLVVMVTRNVELDAGLLPVLLATPAPYIGLMGSQRRWATTREKLRQGGASDHDLDRVQSPIGVEIQAETPAEIAVSIMAAVIAQERG